MPCAASPPSAFCQLKVPTSIFVQSMSWAKAAEVASQIARPVRSAAIQSAFGTRTPLVVPFHVKTMSPAGSMSERSAISPYSAVRISASNFSCLATSVTHPAPKLSHASIVTGRVPRSDQIAISIAPVSDAGTIPSR